MEPTPKTCLRCDWQGPTSDRACPRCGTRPLYVAGASPGGAGATPVPTVASEPSVRSGRWVAASASGALLLILALGAWLSVGGADPDAPAAASAAPSSAGAGSPSAPPAPEDETTGTPERIGIGTQSRTVLKIPFTFSIPSHGWWGFGDLSITKSTIGPQGAEAIVFWTSVWRGNHATACGQWWGSPAGTLADWAEAASKARGTELLEGPVAVTVGGYTAEHVVLRVREDVACNPGFFHHWRAADLGPFWERVDVGDTVRIWLVEVGNTVLYVEADTHGYAGPQIGREVDEIVASMTFD